MSLDQRKSASRAFASCRISVWVCDARQNANSFAACVASPPVSSILMGMEQPDHSVEENRNSLCCHDCSIKSVSHSQLHALQ